MTVKRKRSWWNISAHAGTSLYIREHSGKCQREGGFHPTSTSVNLNNKLGRSAHIALYKKGQSRRLLPGRLRSHYQRCPHAPLRTLSDFMLATALWSGPLCGQHLRKEETEECWLGHRLAAPSVTDRSTLAVGERYFCSLWCPKTQQHIHLLTSPVHLGTSTPVMIPLEPVSLLLYWFWLLYNIITATWTCATMSVGHQSTLLIHYFS